jgi:hypothetical protein
MCVIRVGGEEYEFLEITIDGYAYPTSIDYWDGNWLRADVKVVAGGFRGHVKGYLRADEFECFRDQLAAFLEAFQGTAELRAMEEWLLLRVTGDRRGHLRLAAEIRDKPGIGNTLSCTMEYDQTYFQTMLAALRSAVERFPVRGERPR